MALTSSFPFVRVGALGGVALFAAASLSAQSTQYTAPGSLGRPLDDRQEAVRAAVEGARWQLGAVRVDPWLALKEVAWVEQEEPDGSTASDLTATAGAGLNLYLPVGSRVTLAAQALPEYVWWRDRTDDRRVAGRYALGLFAYANRISLELTARSSDSTSFATPELDRRIDLQSDQLEAQIEVPVLRRFALFARGAANATDAGREGEAADDALLAALDRDEQWWVGGIRWKPREELSIAVGVGRSSAEFDQVGALRDNRGESLYAELAWRRPKLELAAEGFRTEIEPEEGSTFQGFDGTLATARVRWTPRDRFSLSLYGQRGLAYSIDSGRDFYLDQRFGTEVSFRPGWRTSIRLFFESGEHRYEESESQAGADRVDDVTSQGASVDLQFGRGFTLVLGARRTQVENAAVGLDRDFVELRAGLTFGLGGDAGVF